MNVRTTVELRIGIRAVGVTSKLHHIWRSRHKRQSMKGSAPYVRNFVVAVDGANPCILEANHERDLVQPPYNLLPLLVSTTAIGTQISILKLSYLQAILPGRTSSVPAHQRGAAASACDPHTPALPPREGT